MISDHTGQAGQNPQLEELGISEWIFRLLGWISKSQGYRGSASPSASIVFRSVPLAKHFPPSAKVLDWRHLDSAGSNLPA